MAEKKEICRSIKLTESINTAALSITDQIRLLFSRAVNNDEAELDARTKYNVENARRKSALSNLLTKAIDRMQELGESKVTIGVSSEFLPYIDEVTDSKRGLGRYYDIEVWKKDLPQTIRYRFTVVISKRV